MKWNLIEDDWLQLKGNVKRQWPKLTNVDVIIGSSNEPAILGVYTCRPAAF